MVTLVDRMKKGLEDRYKSGMTLSFLSWGDKDVYNREQQKQWV